MTPELFIITTPNDQTRAKHLEQQLFTQKGIDDFKITYWPATMNPGCPQCGISASFRSIVAHAKANCLKEVVVFEDDVWFLCSNSLVRFLNTNLVLPKDCDIFFIGVYNGEIGERFSTYTKLEGRVSGLHGIVVKEQFYDRFLTAHPDYNLDYYLSTEMDPRPVMYVAYPFLALQTEGFSYNRKGQSSHNYQIEKTDELTKCE